MRLYLIPWSAVKIFYLCTIFSLLLSRIFANKYGFMRLGLATLENDAINTYGPKITAIIGDSVSREEAVNQLKSKVILLSTSQMLNLPSQ